jgi:hypothetical protein
MSDTKKVTRPKEFIPDMEQVEKLCRLNCTDAELAAYFGFCRKTIERERRDNPEFDAAIERGKSYGKLSLRRKQVALAEEGNATMLIWLGKQYMGQRDKNELTGADGGPMEHDHTWTVKVEE